MEADVIFRSPRVLIEEKLDGSQVAVASAGDGSAPWIRSKNHVLVKGYGRKGTNAKAQYAPLWNWVYEHAAEFAAPTALLGEVVGVYGEWLYAEHTLCYDLAPDDFIAYQIYRPSLGDFLDPLLARSALSQIDVPARSAFVMSVVTPPERPAAASFTAVPRSLASAISPSLTGAMFAAGAMAAPLVACGVLKIAYDLALLAAFRRARPRG